MSTALDSRAARTPRTGHPVRIWIDLANSPHVPIFAPIVAELRARGHAVDLTARDFAQTVPLARRAFGDGVNVVGGHGGDGMRGKVGAIAGRAVALARTPEARRADMALSFCSHAQNLAARMRRLPALTMMDYEGQPANHLSFRCARRVLVPAAFPEADLRRCGARAAKVRRFPGLKEEIYIAGRAPDPADAGIEVPHDRIVVVLRPPATMAAYHRFENPLFDAVLERVAATPDALGLILPRTADQAARLEERLLPGSLRVVREVPDGLALLAAADLAVGAGGTMNREAAVLGVPAYTVFAGRPAAVDAALIADGRLVQVRTEADLDRIAVRRRNGGAASPPPARTLRAVMDEIERFTEELR